MYQLMYRDGVVGRGRVSWGRFCCREPGEDLECACSRFPFICCTETNWHAPFGIIIFKKDARWLNIYWILTWGRQVDSSDLDLMSRFDDTFVCFHVNHLTYFISGASGIIRGVDIDTCHFSGNFTPRASVQAGCLSKSAFKL